MANTATIKCLTPLLRYFLILPILLYSDTDTTSTSTTTTFFASGHFQQPEQSPALQLQAFGASPSAPSAGGAASLESRKVQT